MHRPQPTDPHLAVPALALALSLACGPLGCVTHSANETDAPASATSSQAHPDALSPDDPSWRFEAIQHERVQRDGRDALRLRGGIAFFADDFTDGVIDFDMSVERQVNFAGVIWHAQSTETYEKFYLRGFLNGREASQYTPVFNDVAGWQLYHGPGYNGSIRFGKRRWVHVRLAVAGDQAEIFVDDLDEPLIFIDDLRLDDKGGKAGFIVEALPKSWPQQPVDFANVVVSHERPTLRGGKMTPDNPTSIVPRWWVSEPFSSSTIADGPIDIGAAHTWTVVDAEPTGLLNIARAHTVTAERETAWLRVVIDSQRQQRKRMRFGFSEEATIYLDGQPVYAGTDVWHEHDVTFQGVVGFWDAVFVPLHAGRNELWVAVTENADMRSGWGLLAAFDDLDGITFVDPTETEPG